MLQRTGSMALVPRCSHTARVCGRADSVEVIHGDGTADMPYTFEQCATRGVQAPTLLFVDPQWGGQQYTKSDRIPADALSMGEGWSMADILQACRLQSAASIVAMSLPFNYEHNVDALARQVVSPLHTTAATASHSPALDERPFPFVLEFGRRLLLIVCLPYQIETEDSSHSAQYRSLMFTNATLDTVVTNLKQFNAGYHEEHHPRFYDYEAMRWISLSRWKGVKLPV